MNVQRLRVTYRKGEPARGVAHLDMVRLWERAMRCGGVPLAYSGSGARRPRIAIAAALAVGVTASAELMDVYLSERVAAQRFMDDVAPNVPPGFDIASVEEVGMGQPSLQSQVRWADYAVTVRDADPARVGGAVAEFLSRDAVPWERGRDGKVRCLDLRPMVQDLRLANHDADGCTLWMRLRADARGSARPEDVIGALGLGEHPAAVHRERLILAAGSPARRAWRLRGRFL